MRRLISLAILFGLCVMLLSACGEQSVDGLMQPVKDADGNITGYETRYYNDNGDVTRLDVYDANQEYDYYVQYEYDSDNRLIKETTYGADGIGQYFYEYTYDTDGALIEKDYCTAHDGSESILYDADGNEVQKYIYDDQGELTRYEVMDNGAWKEAPLPTEAETTEISE